MIKKITVPDTVRDTLQRANIERDSRRDILIYLMSRDDINISPEQFEKYQKEYDAKYLAFEQAKSNLEKEYVLPATNGRANNWSLDYTSCEVTIDINE